jgi:hypothetical protein
MAFRYSRTFRFPKAEWYDAWVSAFENIYALEEALRKIWGRSAEGVEQVKLQIRHDYLLEVTFFGLNNRTDDTLVRSVHDVLRRPLPPEAHALDVVDHILQDGS